MTWNARAGMMTVVSTYWKVGGGIFTDRSPSESPTQLQQSQLDYYGVSVAVDWHRTFGVVSKNGQMLAAPRTMVFGTTVALSYALGLGEIGGAIVGPTPGGGILLEENIVDVVAHEITLHIGSTLAE
jgi:hypothetical protein